MSAGYLNRPNIKAEEYGLPRACPKAECGYRWLKLPGIKMRPCPNCGGELVRRPVRPAAKLATHPASTLRVVKPGGCASR